VKGRRKRNKWRMTITNIVFFLALAYTINVYMHLIFKLTIRSKYYFSFGLINEEEMEAEGDMVN
jgi:hypothetical protein